MMPARYAVIRYIADPARNEPLNIGVVVWNESGFRLEIPEEAALRVVRENPALATDNILYLNGVFQQKLTEIVPFSEERLQAEIAQYNRFPLAISESRFTSLDGADHAAFDATLSRLLSSIVLTGRRFRPHVSDPRRVLAKQLRGLIQSHVIDRNHPFTRTETGLRRVADFYVDSGTHIAIDALQLALTKADDIRRRADAEAWKVYDICAANRDIRYLVYCGFSEESRLEEANKEARKAIETAGAKVLTDLVRATSLIADAASQQPVLPL